MACGLFDAKPSSEPVMTYWTHGLKFQSNFKSKYANYDSRKYIWNIVCNRAAILFEPECVNVLSCHLTPQGNAHLTLFISRHSNQLITFSEAGILLIKFCQMGYAWWNQPRFRLCPREIFEINTFFILVDPKATYFSAFEAGRWHRNDVDGSNLLWFWQLVICKSNHPIHFKLGVYLCEVTFKKLLDVWLHWPNFIPEVVVSNNYLENHLLNPF